MTAILNPSALKEPIFKGVRGMRRKEVNPRKEYDREEDRIRPLIIKKLRSKGFKVLRCETAIAHQLGFGDLWIMHLTGRLCAWVEVKTPTGVQSKEQKEFEALCNLNGVKYIIIRSVEEAENILK